MRVQKTVGANVTDFYYNGSLLLGQKTGTVAQYYTYDASGNLLAIYYNGAYYYYLRNGQGDIVGLLDGTGAVVVSYSYDAWGKPLATTGTLATTLGTDNPFRYRGYYYDTETGLYYLQSRYYDPDTCRFLNGDVLMSTGQGVIGYNMYAYCNNEPVVYSDSSGNNPAIAIPDPGQVSGIGAAIGAIAGTITGASLGTILLVVLAVVVVVAVVVTLVKSAEEEKAKPQHTVYYLRDPQTGEVEYVGRTKNYQSRMAAHARSHRKDLVPEKVMSGLNYYEARALEDKLMLEQHTLNTLRRTANQIRGISPTSDFGIGLAEAAKGIANYYSNKISDDVMNLLGF
jgi:RHS repeat-associated protein